MATKNEENKKNATKNETNKNKLKNKSNREATKKNVGNKKNISGDSTKRNISKSLDSKKKNQKPKKVVDIEVLDTDIKTKLEKMDKNVPNKLEYLNDEVSKEKTNFSLFEVILLIIITILSCLLINNFIDTKPSENKADDDKIAVNVDDEIKKFLEQYTYILDNYYGDINKEQLINEAIKGMLSCLDDYSQVIGEESNSFTVTLEGQYEGVGIVIYNDEGGNIIIQDVYNDTPASRAGLKANDVIIKFNDVSLENVSTSKLVELIASANEMTLTILRNDKEFVIDIKKEKIVLSSVNYKMLENSIGYIDIDIFASNTPEQFEKALKELENKNMKSLIIDLRDNTGGHLTAVEEMLYLFLDKTHIIYQTEDKNGVEIVYSKGKKDKDYKIIVLQNGFSASASEIMASTLKEELNAYIIGNTSFGKGTVQTLKDINGELQYKFTTKRWLTPKGNWIEGIGVKPDLEVVLPNEYYQEPIFDNDTQLKAAIDYLNNL